MTDTTSPRWTFVAKFEDGVVTRMTTFCAGGEFDLRRGMALARAAYDQRTGNHRLEPAAADRKRPPLVRAKFVEPGYVDTVLIEYGCDELLRFLENEDG
jgi:hypothetical protein